MGADISFGHLSSELRLGHGRTGGTRGGGRGAHMAQAAAARAVEVLAQGTPVQLHAENRRRIIREGGR